ncbi:MAG: terminase large subunit [Gemmatimonadetes bacterium]|nr:terminase large subunit [Gemmatimonadota bacterium]
MAGYLAGLTVTQGPRAGAPLRLIEWQRAFLNLFDEPGDVALSVARGNGKTTLVSAVACSALDGPLHEPRAETVIAASSFRQAGIAYEHLLAFMFGSGGPTRKDRERWRVLQSQNAQSIECRETGARVSCIGSDPKRAHGLAPVLVLADEPAQWERSKSDAMLAALRTGLGKIEGGRLVALGTRPDSGEHWFEKMLKGPRSLCFAGEVDADPLDRAAWAAANPSLEHMPHLEAAIAREAAEAARDPSALASFRALRLNAGVSDTHQSTVLDASTWAGIEGDAELTGPYALGVDLSSGAAMSACAAYWPETGALRAFAAFAELPALAERERLDQVRRGLYGEMAARGELVFAGARVVDVGELLREVLRRWGRPRVVVCDRWRERELRQELEAVRFPMAELVVRGQGFKDGGQDLVAFRRACLGGRVRPERSLLLRAAMAEARTVSDPAANEKLAKSAQGGRRSRARDDAAAAAILAVAEGTRRGGWAAPQMRLVAV